MSDGGLLELEQTDITQLPEGHGKLFLIILRLQSTRRQETGGRDTCEIFTQAEVRATSGVLAEAEVQRAAALHRLSG
ncbi:Ribosome maturation factor RimM [Clarias magur]|uniref:Ribosome maturation factor RimM n=1 Tax=Clarias magur TaxID=1594786 RepID=A0A8J4UAC7_CLAMG|nr:Ribosome maturation factor RimM [Clarias magur]